MPVANEPPNTHEATPEIRGPELLAPRRVPLAEGRQVSTNPSFVITRLWPLCDASELERYARASGRPGSNWSVAVEAVASVVAPTVTVQAAASPIPSENTFAPTSSEPLAVAAEDSQPVPDESASAPIAVVALQPAPVAAPVMPSASFTVLRVEEGGATAEAAAPAVLPATVVPSGARIRVAEPMPMPVDETAAAPVPNAAQAITTVAARAHRKAVIHLVAEPTQPSETQLR